MTQGLTCGNADSLSGAASLRLGGQGRPFAAIGLPWKFDGPIASLGRLARVHWLTL